ncbi:hypothetical protein ECH_0384 [Ehrlichia chaffeensis str. Arkansas]|uniref:Uncharacterized protein n=1 Tax=Ehrlichia chaffeensis (strain ATCC CRL-10679 / Arkansas) TaxID=205920 RepID=Q2GH77_EHRCR|nr:hypothetical protein ECH_0386 [Ehrlichia chaffeensis str. Arkansas]ABD44818.1 hypothetical protein ECH_0384 [Ehrlichia chaffeensis str. Arkansas]
MMFFVLGQYIVCTGFVIAYDYRNSKKFKLVLVYIKINMHCYINLYW